MAAKLLFILIDGNEPEQKTGLFLNRL